MKNIRRGQIRGQRHRYPVHPYVLLTHFLYTESDWLREEINLGSGVFRLQVDLKKAQKVTRIRKDVIALAIDYLGMMGLVRDVEHPTNSGTISFSLSAPVRGGHQHERTI